MCNKGYTWAFMSYHSVLEFSFVHLRKSRRLLRRSGTYNSMLYTVHNYRKNTPAAVMYANIMYIRETVEDWYVLY